METPSFLDLERSAKDQKVRDFIGKFWEEHKTSPTLDEICLGFGLTPRGHKSWVHGSCQRLVEKGELYVVWVKFGKRRSYKVKTDEQ